MYVSAMQVISRRHIKQFWERHPDAEKPLRAWYSIASKAAWKGPADAKKQFGHTVDFIKDNRLIFDIGGNKFRLVARPSYEFQRLLVKFVGTHAEYDDIDPEAV